MKKIFLIIFALLIILAVFLFKNNKKEDVSMPIETGASGQFAKLSEDAIVALEQLPGDVVFLNAVNLSGNGFAVIKKDNEGEPGKIIGVSEFLVKGSYLSIDISTTESMSDGLNFYASTYLDNGDGVFDPASDKEKTWSSFSVNKNAENPKDIIINY